MIGYNFCTLYSTTDGKSLFAASTEADSKSIFSAYSFIFCGFKPMIPSNEADFTELDTSINPFSYIGKYLERFVLANANIACPFTNVLGPF